MNAIAIKGKADAQAWESRVEELNERTNAALKTMAELLQSVDSFCKGTLADDLVGYGNKVLDAAQSLLAAMQKIFDVINDLLNMVANAIDQGKEFIGNMVRSFVN